MEQFFSTVITSALVATVAGAAINSWQEARKDKHSTRFEALSVAVSLEGYAITCADLLSDHDLAMSSDGHAGSYMGRVPPLPELSLTAGFLKPYKAKVADRLMIFPQEVRQADQVAAFLWDVTADVDAFRESSAAQVAKMGVKALELAKDIRKAFGLPKRELVFGEYDIYELLKNSLKKYKDGA